MGGVGGENCESDELGITFGEGCARGAVLEGGGNGGIHSFWTQGVRA